MKVRKTVASLITGSALALGLVALPAVAHAEISWVGGGRWDHGADAKDVWSHYDHDTKVHKSSTYGEDGLVSSGWYSAGERSICIQGARLYGNKAYYDFK